MERRWTPGAALVTSTKACEERRSAWLGCSPLITAWQSARSACGEDALGVGVPSSCRVSLGGDQHVLAQRRKVLAAERTAIGGGLAVLRRTDRPPPNAWAASLHADILHRKEAQATTANSAARSVISRVRPALASDSRPSPGRPAPGDPRPLHLAPARRPRAPAGVTAHRCVLAPRSMPNVSRVRSRSLKQRSRRSAASSRRAMVTASPRA